jgi:hypothetical protein
MGGMKEGVEAAGVVTVFVEEFVESVMKLADVVGDKVGEVTVLGLAPQILNRIEFGCIAGKPRHIQPRAARLPQLTDCRAVSGQTIADQE